MLLSVENINFAVLMTSNKWFSSSVLDWYGHNKRNLPWRGLQDPYLVWLSEIILQQTRVEQGTEYFQRFAHKYPRVTDLARASQEDILKDWEGLGYYSRARNLHFTAQFVSTELNGIFPNSYKELIKLKGIGPYTAAAISSICSNEAVAVVDGNVYRALSRVFGIHTPIDSTAGKKEFQLLANSLLDASNAGDFNQAVMEFGATQCTPNAPQCPSCVLSQHCVAYRKGIVKTLPIKAGKVKVRDRFFEFLVLDDQGSLFIEKRRAKDIWEGLFQFPLVEMSEQVSPPSLKEAIHAQFELDVQLDLIHDTTKHILSHQRIHARLWHIKPAKHEYHVPSNWFMIKRNTLGTYALPRLLTKWLETYDFSDIIE